MLEKIKKLNEQKLQKEENKEESDLNFDISTEKEEEDCV